MYVLSVVVSKSCSYFASSYCTVARTFITKMTLPVVPFAPRTILGSRITSLPSLYLVETITLWILIDNSRNGTRATLELCSPAWLIGLSRWSERLSKYIHSISLHISWYLHGSSRSMSSVIIGSKGMLINTATWSCKPGFVGNSYALILKLDFVTLVWCNRRSVM